jgi:hypothetical protein
MLTTSTIPSTFHVQHFLFPTTQSTTHEITFLHVATTIHVPSKPKHVPTIQTTTTHVPTHVTNPIPTPTTHCNPNTIPTTHATHTVNHTTNHTKHHATSTTTSVSTITTISNRPVKPFQQRPYYLTPKIITQRSYPHSKVTWSFHKFPKDLKSFPLRFQPATSFHQTQS